MKNKPVNGWWYEMYFTRNPNESRLKRADDVINYYKFPKLCPKCEKCWEIKSNDRKHPFYYYEKDTLPTYGMNKEICPKCKDNGKIK